MNKEQASSNWEIATACDVKLSPIFAGRDDVLEIDADAIQQSLETLSAGTESKGSVVFTATNLDNPKLNGHYTGRAVGMAWIDKETDSAHAVIGVAGTTDDTGSSFKKEYMTMARKALGTNVLGLGLPLYDIEPEPVWRETDEIQRTSVHELQHVIDFNNARLSKEHEKEAKRLTMKAKAVLVGSEVVAPLAVLGTVGAAQPNKAIMLGAGAVTLAFGRKQSTRIIRKFLKAAYNESKFESRAGASGDRAADLPQIISVKSA